MENSKNGLFQNVLLKNKKLETANADADPF